MDKYIQEDYWDFISQVYKSHMDVKSMSQNYTYVYSSV